MTGGCSYGGSLDANDDDEDALSATSIVPVDHDVGDVAPDPARQQTTSRPSFSLDSRHARLVICLWPDSSPCLASDEPTADMPAGEHVDVGENTKPEYCFSVVHTESPPHCVKEGRANLAQASPSILQDAVRACKDRAKQVVQICCDSQCSQDGVQYPTLSVWRETLCCIAGLEEEPWSLEHCLYAFLIIQACAVATGEPVLLFTPHLVQQLLPLQHLLPDCQLFDAARSVFRMFWMAVHIAEYGCEEREIQRVWSAMPWFGVSASLSGSRIPLDGSNLNVLLSMFTQIRKEQLCTNASVTLGWRRPPPPFVDHVNITVEYSYYVVAPPSLFPPLSLLLKPSEVLYEDEEPHASEDVFLKIRAMMPNDPSMLPLMRMPSWKQLCPQLEMMKRIRLLGGLGKRVMGLDRILHCELRQSVEAYLGFVLLGIISESYPVQELSFSEMLLTIGMVVQPGGLASMTVTDTDAHADKGFRPSRCAITDRWGIYREFNDNGDVLHARICHHMRRAGGCPKYLNFHNCGCACPYLHARTSALGKWLLASARNETTKDPAPWDRAVGCKDERGHLLLKVLPYIDGFCVTPTRWRELDPDHIRPSKPKRKGDRSQKPTRQVHWEDRLTIDAFEPETVRAVGAARELVQLTFEHMQDFW